MKKLMILAVAAAMAMGVNAATTYTYGVLSTTSRGASGGYIGGTSENFCYATLYVYKGTAQISEDNVFSTDGLTLLDSHGSVVSTSSIKPNSNRTSDLLNAAGGDAYTLVLVSATQNGQAQAIRDTTILTEGGTYAMLVINGVSAVNGQGIVTLYDNGTPYAASDFTTVTFTAQAIPEPTSGLLMLLGVAGLALRRKRA